MIIIGGGDLSKEIIQKGKSVNFFNISGSKKMLKYMQAKILLIF